MSMFRRAKKGQDAGGQSGRFDTGTGIVRVLSMEARKSEQKPHDILVVEFEVESWEQDEHSNGTTMVGGRAAWAKSIFMPNEKFEFPAWAYLPKEAKTMQRYALEETTNLMQSLLGREVARAVLPDQTNLFDAIADANEPDEDGVPKIVGMKCRVVVVPGNHPEYNSITFRPVDE